jgi:hypothetical protein
MTPNESLLYTRIARDQMQAKFAEAGAIAPGLLIAYSIGDWKIDRGSVGNADAITEALKTSFPEQFKAPSGYTCMLCGKPSETFQEHRECCLQEKFLSEAV